ISDIICLGSLRGSGGVPADGGEIRMSVDFLQITEKTEGRGGVRGGSLRARFGNPRAARAGAKPQDIERWVIVVRRSRRARPQGDRAGACRFPVLTGGTGDKT